MSRVKHPKSLQNRIDLRETTDASWNFLGRMRRGRDRLGDSSVVGRAASEDPFDGFLNRENRVNSGDSDGTLPTAVR